MANIQYPIQLPAVFHSMELTWTPVDVVGVSVAPQSLIEQTYEFPGKQWQVHIKLPPMKRRQAELINGFLLSLNGPSGTFYLGDTANKIPQGVATGNPVVDGIQTQFSQTCSTRGWTPNVNGILLCGDWVQMYSGGGQRLYKVLADVNSDGAGKAVIPLWPRLRDNSPDASPLFTKNAQGIFYLAANVPWSIDVARIYGIEIGALESLF